MLRCIDLAVKGLGNVAPNPMVGCVIVREGKIIGEGFHQKLGQAHAEVNAINSVNDKALLKDATLYVSLEPCSHHGKTPPCADLIIKHQIPKVVVGSNDPNPLVAGNGIRKLKGAGVEVITNVLKAETDFMNRRFITYHTQKRPYIILKWAQSVDGFIAPNEPKQQWLTGGLSKKLVHQWRSEEQAILIGRKTLEIDNPILTTRLVEGKNPLRLVLAKDISRATKHKVFGDGQVWVFNANRNAQEGDIRFVQMDFVKDVPSQMLEYLWKNDIQSVIVEGGAATLSSFISAGLWDEARVFTAPVTLKEGKPAPVVKGTTLSEETIDKDKLQVVYNPNQAFPGRVK